MMGNAADSTQKSSSDSGSTGAARDYSEQQQVISDIKPEIDQWQARIDAAKLQMHLGAREARAKLQPHVEKLEQDLGRVKASWAQLEESSENAWKDTQHGLRISLLALRRSYDKAKQHFENPDHS
jgi:predicted  nucleic acid-binding Zn-ribbon protein